MATAAQEVRRCTRQPFALPPAPPKLDGQQSAVCALWELSRNFFGLWVRGGWASGAHFAQCMWQKRFGLPFGFAQGNAKAACTQLLLRRCSGTELSERILWYGSGKAAEAAPGQLLVQAP